jgi:hypothetical protein
MTEEQVKFWFNSMYKVIMGASIYDGGISFDDLINWANHRKLNDDVFMSMLDEMEATKLVTRQGERYSAL